MTKTKAPFYSLVQAGQEATLNIYGDITSLPCMESDVSAHMLSERLNALRGVSQINVYINSYGGEVGEGVAIYNALKRHSAHVTTYCDSFACSVASVIFMAGDERIMAPASLLMIHNAWTSAEGNANDLRKLADDLDTISDMSVQAYLQRITLDEKTLRKKMNAETWITPADAVAWGFATAIGEDDETKHVAQSTRRKIQQMLMNAVQAEEEPEDDEDEEETPTPPTDDETEEKDPDEEEPEEQNDEEKPAQKWSGFFNAILKGEIR